MNQAPIPGVEYVIKPPLLPTPYRNPQLPTPHQSANQFPYQAPLYEPQYLYQMQVPYWPIHYWFTPNTAQVQPQQQIVPINGEVQKVPLPVTQSHVVLKRTNNVRDPRRRSKTKSTSKMTSGEKVKWNSPKKITEISKPDYKKRKSHLAGIADPRSQNDAKDCDYSLLPMELCETFPSTGPSIDTPVIPESSSLQTSTSSQDGSKNTTRVGHVKVNGRRIIIGQIRASADKNAGGDVRDAKECKMVAGDLRKDTNGAGIMKKDQYKVLNVEVNEEEVRIIAEKKVYFKLRDKLIGERAEFVTKLEELLTMGLESLQRAMEKKINKKTALTFKMEQLQFQDLEENAQRFLKNEKPEYRDMDISQLLTYRDSIFDCKKLIACSRSDIVAKFERSCGQSVLERMFNVLFRFQNDYCDQLAVAICEKCKKKSASTTKLTPELVDLALSDEETNTPANDLETTRPVIKHAEILTKNDIIAPPQPKNWSFVSPHYRDASSDVSNVLTPLPSPEEPQRDIITITTIDTQNLETEIDLRRESCKRPLTPSTNTELTTASDRSSNTPSNVTPTTSPLENKQVPKSPLKHKATPYLYGYALPSRFSILPHFDTSKSGMNQFEMPTDLMAKPPNFEIPAKKVKYRA